MHHRQAKPVESGPTWRLAFAYTEAAPSNGTQQQEPYSLWELQYLSSPSPSLPLPLSHAPPLCVYVKFGLAPASGSRVKEFPDDQTAAVIGREAWRRV